MNHYSFNHKPRTRPPVVTRRDMSIRSLTGISNVTDTVTNSAFVRAMRGTATGVNVVTTDGLAGRFGLTVSAFSSVSAEPPTVLICINRKSIVCKAVRDNGAFCVNALSTDQRSVAEQFSGKPAGQKAYGFEPRSWTKSRSGAPLLDHSIASFDCTLESAIDAGTHTIFIGAVRAVQHNNASPLLYTDGSYRRACSEI